MYNTYLHVFASLSGVFLLFSPLNIYISLFSVCLLSPCSLPAACAPPCPLLPSPGAWPSVSLSPPPLPAFPPLVLRSSCSCRVFRGCRAVCPLSFSPFVPIWRALKLSGGLLCVVPCVVCCPSLVSYQAQNGVTVWADAPRICPRPCLLLPMCCRVSRWLFRGLSRGFRPCVRVCVRVCVLPGVVWW